jgi:hypothetical protein
MDVGLGRQSPASGNFGSRAKDARTIEILGLEVACIYACRTIKMAKKYYELALVSKENRPFFTSTFSV